MKGKRTKRMTWRLQFKLAAVVLLTAAALLITTVQPAAASTVCPSRRCLSDATILGCCSRITASGYDSRGACSVHAIACWHWKRG